MAFVVWWGKVFYLIPLIRQTPFKDDRAALTELETVKKQKNKKSNVNLPGVMKTELVNIL